MGLNERDPNEGAGVSMKGIPMRGQGSQRKGTQ